MDIGSDDTYEQPLWRHLGQTVRELATEHQTVIELRYFAGATWRAIAEHTGRDGPDAARLAHGRAMAEFRRRFRVAIQTRSPVEVDRSIKPRGSG